MINQKMFESLQPGVAALSNQLADSKRQRVQIQADQDLETQKSQQQMALEHFLKGTTGADGNYQPGVEAKAQQLQDQTKNVAFSDMVNKFFPDGKIPEGAGVVSPLGGSVSKGFNYRQFGFQNNKAEQQAYQQAATAYQHGIASNATSVQALHSLLGALQSNDPSSMGQIRTAMVLANGFKRYNDNEGTALTPDDKQADVSKLLASYGLSLKDASLNDSTRANVVRFANNKLDDLQDAHNTLKSQAQNMYSNSQFADPTKAANLGSTLGAPVDQQLKQMKQRFDEFHSKAIPNTPAQGSDAPSVGTLGAVKQGLSGFFGKPSAPAQTQQQAPTAPLTGGAPQGGGNDDAADFAKFYNNVWKKMNNGSGQ